MADTIFVKSKMPTEKDGGSPVTLWEVHDDHPGGEVYIAGDKPVEVAETEGVLGALRDDKLERVRAEKSASK